MHGGLGRKEGKTRKGESAAGYGKRSEIRVEAEKITNSLNGEVGGAISYQEGRRFSRTSAEGPLADCEKAWTVTVATWEWQVARGTESGEGKKKTRT